MRYQLYKSREELLKRRQKVLIIIIVVAVLVLGALFYRTVSDYIAVKRCANSSLTYWVQNKCSKIINLEDL